MLVQIGLFLLQTIAHVFAACFLFRFYAFLYRININSNGSNLGRFIFALTDWAVLPLRQFLPRFHRLDLPSLLPPLAILFLLSLVKSLALMGGVEISTVLILFTIDTVSLIISLLTALLIIQAVLSWIQPSSPVQYVLHQLTDPILQPIRRALPLVGGIDLSPLVALLLLQVLSMVVRGL